METRYEVRRQTSDGLKLLQTFYRIIDAEFYLRRREVEWSDLIVMHYQQQGDDEEWHLERQSGAREWLKWRWDREEEQRTIALDLTYRETLDLWVAVRMRIEELEEQMAGPMWRQAQPERQQHEQELAQYQALLQRLNRVREGHHQRGILP